MVYKLRSSLKFPKCAKCRNEMEIVHFIFTYHLKIEDWEVLNPWRETTTFSSFKYSNPITLAHLYNGWCLIRPWKLFDTYRLKLKDYNMQKIKHNLIWIFFRTSPISHPSFEDFIILFDHLFRKWNWKWL